MRIGVLASHEGTTLQAVLDAVASGRLRASVAVVISNNRDSGALRRAQASGVPAVRLSSATHPDPDQLDGAILEELADARVDVVLLAGYMKKLGPRVLEEYRGRILNTHPALLPKFGGQGMYGSRVHEAVLASGDAETGATIHIVDAEYDTGPIVAQCRVPVLPGDSAADLASRVQARERELVVETLARMAEGKLGGGSKGDSSMGVLTDDMKRVVTEQRLGFVATVCPDGTPNLSPKGTTAVWDDDHLVFANIRSPNTVANLRRNANLEINVVDPLLRKGYRFKGVASILESGPVYDDALAFYEDRGVTNPIREIVMIRVRSALPIDSPAYDLGMTEDEVRAVWERHWESIRAGRTSPTGE